MSDEITRKFTLEELAEHPKLPARKIYADPQEELLYHELRRVAVDRQEDRVTIARLELVTREMRAMINALQNATEVDGEQIEKLIRKNTEQDLALLSMKNRITETEKRNSEIAARMKNLGKFIDTIGTDDASK